MLLSQASSQGAATSRPLSVSEAMQAAKRSLESITVKLIGEVSEVNAKAGYKAVYFTVKDAGASLPCMIWLNRYHQFGVQLCVGQRVELMGRFTLYAPKGRMNFDVFSISLAGEGDLRRRVAELARRLEREGLMAASRKRPVGSLYEHIGLVTSPRGAAVHDVLRTIRRRFPVARISLAGVAVEGSQAPQGIVFGIDACVRAGCEVILVVRGGGSFEDLMPFNDERLARAIAACPVPVVTGIGHEPDTSIADMVADVRSSTPTAAAERVSPDSSTLLRELDACAASMSASQRLAIERYEARLGHIASRPLFKDPHLLFSTDLLTLDLLHDRLSRALPECLAKDSLHLNDMQRRLCDRAKTSFERFEHDLALHAGRLHDLSPLAVLSRGYAIAKDEEGSVVCSIHAVHGGDRLDVAVSDGVISCSVNYSSPHTKAE